jgi:hypothetical protein
MIFHFSIAADDPARVARVVAELWGGDARIFPPVGTGSAVAIAGDNSGTTLEIYARGTELVPGEGDADAYATINSAAPRLTATHGAIATALSQADVLAIAEREGWIAKYRNRGGFFGVIELWLENATLIEVLTPEMQAEYRAIWTQGGPPWPAVAAA